MARTRGFSSSSSQLEAKIFAGYDGNAEFLQRSGVAGNVAFGAAAMPETPQLPGAADVQPADFSSAPENTGPIQKPLAPDAVASAAGALAARELPAGGVAEGGLAQNQAVFADGNLQAGTLTAGSSGGLPAAALSGLAPASGNSLPATSTLHSAPGSKHESAGQGGLSVSNGENGTTDNRNTGAGGNGGNTGGGTGSNGGGSNAGGNSGGGNSGGGNSGGNGNGGSSSGGDNGGNNPGGNSPGGGGGGNTGTGGNNGNGNSGGNGGDAPYTPASPVLTIEAGHGHSGQPGFLTIDLTADTHAGVATVVDITGLPAGAILSAGTHNADGSWTLMPGDLAALTVTPAAGFTGQIDLTATAHSSYNGADYSANAQAVIDVDEAAQAPVLSVLPVAGFENAAIPLSIDAHVAAGDSGAALTIVISGVPAGAVLSAGVHNADGTWTLSTADLANLALMPPSGYTGDIPLSVTATAAENNTAVNVAATAQVNVMATAETPSLAVQGSAGIENTAIALNIGSTIGNPHGSETLSIEVGGVPAGGTLSAGMHNPDGTWTLSPADLTHLTMTPPADYTGTLALQITATATDADGSSAQNSASLDISIAAAAQAPVLVALPSAGFENTAIAVDIGAHVAAGDPGAVLTTVIIAGVPDGAILSAGTHNQDGSWTLSAGDLTDLILTPPSGYAGDIQISVTATASENGTSAAATTMVDIDVKAAAEIPALIAQNASGIENTAIALNIASSIVNPHGSETLSITLSGVPDGATLSAGTHNPDGTWTVSPADLAHLTLTPPLDYTGTLALQATAVASDADGDSAQATASLAVTATAQAPILAAPPVSGIENTAIPLSIDAHLATGDAGAALTIVVTGVPDSATLSAGTHNQDGSWTLSAADLNSLTLTPPSGYTGAIQLSITATAAENGTSGSVAATTDVNVMVAAEIPSLTVHDTSGAENTAIALQIAGAIVNPHGSETLSVDISGVPAGAHLSAGADAGNGVWLLSASDLANLSLTPPQNYTGTMALQVTAIATDADGDAAHISANLDVTATAEAPVLLTLPASGLENTPIALSLDAHLGAADPGAALAVVITGVPAGAILSAGTQNPDGGWTLSASDLANLTLTPPDHYTGDIQLSITATATENGTSGTVNAGLDVHVMAAAEIPLLAVHDVSGVENAAIALNIGSSIVNLHGSENLSFVIAGVPDGALLSAGLYAGNGAWSLSAADLTNLSLTPSENYTGTMALQVTAVATDADGDSAQASAVLHVDVTATALAPLLSLQAAAGLEDQPVALDIGAALAPGDTADHLSVTVTGVPAGASLSAGTHNQDGSWTLSATDLTNLTLTPPANSDNAFTLTVAATATAPDNSVVTVHGTLPVMLTGVADLPTLSVQDATGTGGTPIALTVNAALTDTDGSEHLSVLIHGVPAGFALSAGMNNGDNSWTLSASDLAGLKLIAPAGFNGNLTLYADATSHEDNGTTATTTDQSFVVHIGDANNGYQVDLGAQVQVGGIGVGVTTQLGTPLQLLLPQGGLLVGGGITVGEHTPYLLADAPNLLHLGALGGLTGLIANIEITGMAAGATLSSGTNLGNGAWSLATAQLNNLYLTPPAGSDTDFTLHVTANMLNGLGSVDLTTTAVHIFGLATLPTLSVSAGVAVENQAVGLNIAGALTNTDGTTDLSFAVSGVPQGFTINHGTDNGNGSWSLQSSDLGGLTLTPSTDYTGSVNLTVSAIATENDGNQAVQQSALPITIAAAIEAPSLAITTLHGTEDHAVAVNLGLTLPNAGAEHLTSVTISGLTDGATLTGATNNHDGTWSADINHLDQLLLTPGTHWSGDATLSLNAAASLNDGSASTSTTAHIALHVDPVAVAPVIVAADADVATGNPGALSLGVSLATGDTTDHVSATISGLTAGTTLSAGHNNGDGSWTLNQSDLAHVTITTPAQVTGDLHLMMTGFSRNDNGSIAETQQAFTVHVHPADWTAAVAQAAQAAPAADHPNVFQVSAHA